MREEQRASRTVGCITQFCLTVPAESAGRGKAATLLCIKPSSKVWDNSRSVSPVSLPVAVFPGQSGTNVLFASGVAIKVRARKVTPAHNTFVKHRAYVTSFEWRSGW